MRMIVLMVILLLSVSPVCAWTLKMSALSRVSTYTVSNRNYWIIGTGKNYFDKYCVDWEDCWWVV